MSEPASEHVRCDWTWPNEYGIVVCLDHQVIISTDDAWHLEDA